MAVTRHLVLDNQAVYALLSMAEHHPTRKQVVTAITAANGRRVVPTAVRAEAGWRRADPAAAYANQLVGDDDILDGFGADRVVELMQAVEGASLVDAAVVVAAERIGLPGVVEILTSDQPDLEALAAEIQTTTEVVPL